MQKKISSSECFHNNYILYPLALTRLLLLNGVPSDNISSGLFCGPPPLRFFLGGQLSYNGGYCP